MDEVKAAVAGLGGEIVSLRREFHRYPEPGFQEFRTRDRIKDFLTGLGIPVFEMARTGLVGLLEGGAGSGRTILLRADIDGLPVTEETGLPFASEITGMMHACGHDGHIAMLLGAAAALTRLRKRFSGTVKFVFQPNEEDAGAWLMIDEGVLEAPRVDAAFGCHLWSQVDTGYIDLSPGPVMASSHYFTLSILGKGGHAGFAHESIDPIFVASAVIQAVQAIQSREVDALNPVVIMFTQAIAGSSATIVPPEITLKGSIRVLYDGGEADVMERFERIVKSTCEAHRAGFRLEFSVGNRLLSNDPAMTCHAGSAARLVLGDESRVTSRVRTMAGEDFSEFARNVPASFAFVGIRNPEKGVVFPHHHPRFTIDEDALPIGTELYVRTALGFLGQ